VDVVVAVDESLLADDPPVQRDRGVDAADHEFLERAAQAHQAFVAGAAVHDQLADQRIVVGRDRIAGIERGIDAHAQAARRVIVGDLARGGREGLGVLGVDPALDGVAVDHDVLLRKRQRRAGGDADLLAHQVDAGDHLGDRMLDLQARVHLDEVELAVLVQELDRAGAAVA
jgi:hypothetical protein